MSKFPLDLSKFKKLSSDKNTTTLEHPQGHKITLAHNSLSPKLRAALAQIPVKKTEEVKKYADGGPVEGEAPAPELDPSVAPAISPYTHQPITINFGGQPATSSPSSSPSSTGAIQDINWRDLPPGAPSPVPAPSPQSAAPVASPEQGPPSQAPQPPSEAQRAPAASQDPYGADAYGNALESGIAEQKLGLMSGAKAEGDLGREQAAILDRQATQEANQRHSYQSHFQELDKERKALEQDLKNSHIDPTHYLASMGTSQRISTAIGLILGGMGGGMTGQANPVLGFLEQNINHDIDAQKADLGKKENLLSANMRQFGNLRDATDMTRIMQSDIVSNQLKRAAASAADPMAKARALQAAGAIDTNSAQQLSQVALRKSISSASTQGNQDDGITKQVQYYRMMGNEPMAKNLEERHVPGLGLAQVPVNADIRGKLLARQQLDKAASDFYSFAAKNSGSLSLTTINQGKTMAAELSSMYRAGIDGGVYKKGEQEFIEHIVPTDPTSFLGGIRILPKIKELMRSNSQQLNGIKKSVGLPAVSAKPIQVGAPVKPS